MKRQFIFIFIAAVLTARPVPAQDMLPNAARGSDLYLLCNSKYDTDYGYCAGYITAIAETMSQQDVNGLSACNLDAVRSQQLVDIVKTYLVSNADLHSYTAKELVARALSRAFPCF